MAAKSKRAMVSVPEEWEPEISRVKQSVFYNETKAEMYRQLIRLGLDTLHRDSPQKNSEE